MLVSNCCHHLLIYVFFVSYSNSHCNFSVSPIQHNPDDFLPISSRHSISHISHESEVQRTVLELLNQLDGFETTKNIKVIMATNQIGMPFVSLGYPIFA